MKCCMMVLSFVAPGAVSATPRTRKIYGVIGPETRMRPWRAGGSFARRGDPRQVFSSALRRR
jgi:hypothetical protein